ncbi:hypothetical protein [Streptomyces sp. NBC_01261]|uniref:hypothetical protein n=1 Tax=Streptomyces sp. NBC_01261 TaxID=2903802 RepID=UPI002E2F0758|nr:hypothetical protein [Streptomyces sp. NBC_01261]
MAQEAAGLAEGGGEADGGEDQQAWPGRMDVDDRQVLWAPVPSPAEVGAGGAADRQQGLGLVGPTRHVRAPSTSP